MNEMHRKPNLFVIGAMKSGTTSLHEYLDTHPQIAMSTKKEPAFFVEELTMRRGENWYLSLFENNRSCRYLGESSTHYTMRPLYQGVPERLHHFNRNARLIYIMRDPFDRVVSHYWHAVRVRSLNGEGEPRHLLKAVLASPHYLAVSDYAFQLQPYIDLFGRESLYTLTFENLVKDPQCELDHIYRWLDIPPHPLGDKAAQAYNQKPSDIAMAAGTGVLYRIRFSNAWDRLSPHIPAWLKNWSKKLAYKPMDERKYSDEVARLRTEIGELQRRQIDRLSLLLGRDFPEWRTTC